MAKISVAIITKDEGKRLADALRSVEWADEVVVVDSGSSDNTLDVAKGFTDKVYARQFDDFSSQKNFAASKCSNEWVFSLDADEVVSEGLRDMILSAAAYPGEYSAFSVRRVNRLFGKVLSHSAGADYPVRLFIKDKASFRQPIHEYLKVDGKTGRLEGELMHNSTQSIRSEYEKTDMYTDMEARWMLENNMKPGIFKFLVYPFLMFIKLYFFKLGILEGKEGLVYAFVSARYSYVKYAKARRLAKDPKYLEDIISGRFNVLSESFPDAIDPSDFRVRGLINNFQGIKGKRILEIGCGKGRFTGYMSEIGGVAVGTDISEKLLQVAVKKNKGEYIKASATDLPFGDNTFDCVFSVEVVEHLPEIGKMMEEAARVLKPGGIFLTIDKNIFSINNKRLLVPNVLIKKYHEKKNDWMYPKGFAFTEKWFLKRELSGMLLEKFNNVEAEYLLSDSERDSKISFLFKKVPASRHFILWKAVGPKK